MVVDGKRQGFGFVSFEDAESAQKVRIVSAWYSQRCHCCLPSIYKRPALDRLTTGRCTVQILGRHLTVHVLQCIAAKIFVSFAGC